MSKLEECYNILTEELTKGSLISGYTVSPITKNTFDITHDSSNITFKVSNHYVSHLELTLKSSSSSRNLVLALPKYLLSILIRAKPLLDIYNSLEGNQVEIKSLGSLTIVQNVLVFSYNNDPSKKFLNFGLIPNSQTILYLNSDFKRISINTGLSASISSKNIYNFPTSDEVSKAINKNLKILSSRPSFSGILNSLPHTIGTKTTSFATTISSTKCLPLLDDEVKSILKQLPLKENKLQYNPTKFNNQVIIEDEGKFPVFTLFYKDSKLQYSVLFDSSESKLTFSKISSLINKIESALNKIPILEIEEI